MPIYIGILWLAYWERIQEREKMKKWNRKNEKIISSFTNA